MNYGDFRIEIDSLLRFFLIYRVEKFQIWLLELFYIEIKLLIEF